MSLYYIYFLPNQPKVGMTIGRRLDDRIKENRRRGICIEGWIIVGAALSKVSARQMEREYQARYNCLDGMDNPAIVAKRVHASTKPGYTVWNKGKQLGPQSEEVKEKKRAKLKGIPRPQVQCPHCNTVGGQGSMARWHFGNCKFKM